MLSLKSPSMLDGGDNLVAKGCIRFVCTLTIILSVRFAQSQTPAQNEPDEMILNDGERVIGHLEQSSGSTVKFKSDILGELSVDWSKIKELHSSQKFAVIEKSATVKNKQQVRSAPVGSVSVQDQNLTLGATSQPAAQQPVPVSNVADLVNQAAFEKAFRPTSFLQGWSGGATGGISLTEATQKNQTFTGALNMVRAVPDVDWLSVTTRTLINFNEAYSQLTEPGTPTVKTSLTHFDAEQDWYLSPRFFLFASAAFDHSFSQGLDLQQNYGAGVGYVLIKSAVQELDVKASMNYIHQEFESGPAVSLIASLFAETYTRKFAHGILLNETGSIIPSWNNTNDYTALASAGLTFPVYHRIGFTIGALDNFLNDPPPGFKKNSFQLTVGATYSFNK